MCLHVVLHTSRSKHMHNIRHTGMYPWNFGIALLHCYQITHLELEGMQLGELNHHIEWQDYTV